MHHVLWAVTNTHTNPTRHTPTHHSHWVGLDFLGVWCWLSVQLGGAEQIAPRGRREPQFTQTVLAKTAGDTGSLSNRLHQMHKMFSHWLMKAKEFKGVPSQETVPTHSSPTSLCHLYTVGHSWIQSKDKMSLIFRFYPRLLKLKLKVENHSHTEHAITNSVAAKPPNVLWKGLLVFV